MSASYRHCAECGKRALSIATRCPGCGRELPNPATPDDGALDLGPLRSAPVVLGLLAALVALGGIRLERRTSPPPGEESAFAPPSSTAPLSVDPLAATPTLGNPTVIGAPATAAGSATPATAAASATAARSVTAAGPVTASAAADTSRVLVARSWTYVRSRRSPKAELSAVLTPGDTVLADSLSQGWYRVALEGEVMGYAYRSALAEIK